MSISQKRGVITLIPKKKKNKPFLDNWRPISLLNTDYKIATKAIAASISKVLPVLINGDQTGNIKGRSTAQNVRLIADIIECTEALNISGIALFLDFKKACDSIEWHFIFKTLETLGFDLPLLQWVRTLLITYKALNNLAPSYICDLLTSYTPSRQLRSSSKHLLVSPSYNLKTYGARPFSVAAPSLWNALPCEIRNAPSVSFFKSRLKTFLFTKAFYN